MQGEHFAIYFDYTDPRYPLGHARSRTSAHTRSPLSGEEADPDHVVAHNDAMIDM